MPGFVLFLPVPLHYLLSCYFYFLLFLHVMSVSVVIFFILGSSSLPYLLFQLTVPLFISSSFSFTFSTFSLFTSIPTFVSHSLGLFLYHSHLSISPEWVTRLPRLPWVRQRLFLWEMNLLVRDVSHRAPESCTRKLPMAKNIRT